MDTKIFKRTQDTLGKIIVRPPLTDKLLAKPPFRFLHDIITSVIKGTGFMHGLYSSEEHNSDNVKDKESKMKFLQKAIDIVSLVTEKQLSVRPSKVVAGHEPEKTNEFLQLLAEAIKKQVDNDVYVQRVLKGTDGSKKQESNKDKEKSKEKSRDKRQPENEEQHKSKEKGSKENNSKGDRHKNQSENEIKTDERERRSKTEGKEKRKNKSEQKSRNRGEDKESQQNKIEERERQRNKLEEREKYQAKDEEKSKEKQPSDKEKSSRKSLKDSTKENEKPSQETNEKSPDDITLRKLTRPTSAKGSRHKKEENEVSPVPSDMQLSSAVETTDSQQTKISPKAPEHSSLARVGSARRAPPKLRTSEVIDDPMIQLGTGKPTNVITDDGVATDEEEQFILEDATLLPNKNVTSKTDETGTVEDGGLVNKLLETKKELEGTIASEEKSKVKIDNSIRNNTEYQRQREQTESKILKLQGSIQGLTKSANPLGKIMDYIQEDLDSMHKELNQWKGEKLEYRLALKEEREITEKALQPLKFQLATLDEAIQDQLDIIATIKANVIRNDSRIEAMLHSVAKL